MYFSTKGRIYRSANENHKDLTVHAYTSGWIIKECPDVLEDDLASNTRVSELTFLMVIKIAENSQLLYNDYASLLIT
jgi:hypothetical protein